MNREKDNLATTRQVGIMACARTLADDANLELTDVAQLDRDLAYLIRAQTDALALKHAHHDASIHARHLPGEPLSRLLFAVLERERYEALGANAYKGVRLNLDSREFKGCTANSTLQPAPYAPGVQVCEGGSADFQPDSDPVEQLQLALAVICRTAFRTDNEVQHGTVTGSMEYFRLRPLVARWLPSLSRMLGDQAGFALQARTLASELAMLLADDDLARSAGLRQFPDAVSSELQAIDAGINEGGEQADCESPDATFSADKLAGENQPADDSSGDAQGEAQQTDPLSNQIEVEAPGSGPDPRIIVSGDSSLYRAFTTRFDEVACASDFAGTEELRQWREELDQHNAIHGRLVRRLAARLQRSLLARQKRHWQFDLEEGQLDLSRLSRIVTDPLIPLSFKSESDIAFRNTTITLLIDNSRSMLGRPIMIAASCADVLARTLERCGVTVEILGFTTTELHGGRSTELWESQGRLDSPGRLNDLRHIVYKSAEMPYRSARRNLGLLLDKNILKQNIDGEALLWAHGRLMKRPEERRILMMISDGAPVETSTLSANAGDYLARHLQQVVVGIEKSSSVELLAIGIGHDVSRFYSRAMKCIRRARARACHALAAGNTVSTDSVSLPAGNYPGFCYTKLLAS